MKLNKKGFMLAEVVIVAAVISGILVASYISLNRISNAYDKRNRYYDIDAMYAAMNINDSIVRENITSINSEISSSNSFCQFYNRDDNEISYKIKKVYYLLSNVNYLKDITAEDAYLNDYIDYLKDNIKFECYDYLILVELQKKDVDDIYFYTLKGGVKCES